MELPFSNDMIQLMKLFRDHGVEYLLVGGYAVNYYGYARATQDLDLLVRPSSENAKRIMASLNEFGFGNAGIPSASFETPGTAIHLGSEPNRIDLLTTLKDMDLDWVFEHRELVTLGSLEIPIIHLGDLIKTKKRAGRLRDLADAEELENRKNP